MRPLRLATAFKNASLPSRVSPAKIRTGRLFSSLKRTQPLPVATVARLRDIRGRPGIPGSRHSFYSTQKVSFSDSGRSSLFYHLVGPPTPLSRTQPAFALSFLEKPPVDSDSSTITGWLPATSVDTALEGQEPGLNDFRENPKFRTLLHEAIKSGLEEQVDEIQINGALQLQDGWMHIHDDRNIPPLGRIGDPDDIIATVLVHDSKIVTETYQPMPSYRMCTADGILTLTPGLAQQLQKTLVKQAESEQSSS